MFNKIGGATKKMNKKIIIVMALVSLIFISGCDNPFDANYGEVCKEIYQPTLTQLDYYKELSREQSKELGVHSVTWISPEDFLYEVKDKCLLIVTEGKEPQQADWFTENGFTQFERDDIFPIRTWDLETDQIEDGYDFNGWKYWVRCKK